MLSPRGEAAVGGETQRRWGERRSGGQDDRQWIQEVASTQEAGGREKAQETLLITAARMRT